MELGRCEVGACQAGARITYLGHGICEKHWDRFTEEEASPEALRMALGVEAPTVLPMEEIMVVPKAGSRRGKRSGSQKAATKLKPAKPRRSGKDSTSGEEQVVFAFRLSRADRDRIHGAAGPAGATQFVRSAALAAATGDNNAFDTLVTQAKTNLK